MDIKERLKNIWKMLESWDQKRLETYKNSLFFVIVVDLFGIYHFLGLKQLGMAIMIVSMALLGLILYLLQKFPKKRTNERRKPKKMNEEEEKTERNLDIGMNEDKSKEEPKEKEKSFLEFDTGLGSSEDYNKRMEKAFGTV